MTATAPQDPVTLAIAALVKLLHDPTPEVRIAAADQLLRYRREGVL